MATENGSVASGPVDCMSLGSLGSHGGSCGSLDTVGMSIATNSTEQSTVFRVCVFYICLFLIILAHAN